MAKLVVFRGSNYTGASREYRSNDPDLVVNLEDFEFESAIAITGDWELFDDLGHSGNKLDLMSEGGPDFDGAYKDPADLPFAGAFHVRSIRHSE
ncbi:hypothetical protein OS190_18605 [Sulfitobacter sp. F26204]|uniref:hypothetical protein n=1 Tax=Sulfitobacter sp. F26204 TaxID=2996014 RepID=UPI00225E158D|nr:hypothetical protein [Sulfitobacter sp. F26204]MCX7561578.1 hypothetical protein [Sulfitobacter sp. F26204]